MNILPKKRWHVRTKDNIARVRKDEAKAAEEEKEKERRAKLAEQESRTALLRQQARDRAAPGSSGVKKHEADNKHETENNPETDNKHETQGTADEFSRTTVVADIYTEEGNINFFKDLETGRGMCNAKSNKEHDEEERAEKEKYEKQIGLLTYLGQDSIEAKGGKEWYNDDSQRVSALFNKAKASDTLLTAASKKRETLEETNSDEEVGLKSKKRIDPLNDIIKYSNMKVSSKPQCKDSKAILPITHKAQPEALKCPDEKRVKKLRKMLKKKKKLEEQLDKWDLKSSCDNIKEKRGTKRGRSESSERSSSPQRRPEESRKRTTCSKKKRKKSSKSKHRDKGTSCSVRSKDKKKRCKQNKGRRESSSSSTESTNSEAERKERHEQKKKLMKMRSERMAREAAERSRARLLLFTEKNKEEEDNDDVSDRGRAYNSQFNPLLARQNKTTLKTGTKYF